MTPGANPPVCAMARAVVCAYPWMASVRTAARRIRSRLPARATSDDPPRAHAGAFEVRVEPAGQFGQVMAGHLRVEVVFEVIGQLEEQGGDHPPAQRARLRQRGVPVIMV